MPVLADLVDFAAGHPELGWLLEFKGEWNPDQVAAAAEPLRDAGLAGRCVLQGFSPRTVRSLHAAAPDIDRGLLIMMQPAPGEEHQLLRFLAETATGYCNPHGGILQFIPAAGFHAAGRRRESLHLDAERAVPVGARPPLPVWTGSSPTGPRSWPSGPGWPKAAAEEPEEAAGFNLSGAVP